VITGQHNYRKAIGFQSPAYLPCDISVSFEWLRENDTAKQERIRELQAKFPQDILPWLEAARTSERVTRGGASHWRDEWGTGWKEDGNGAKPEHHPLAEGYSLVASHPFPDPHLEGRFQEVDRKLATRGDRYVRAVVWFTLFERLWMLRGFENTLMDPYTQEREWSHLRDRVVDYNLALIDQFLARGVHGIFFSDDWGSQRSLLMDPDDWRRFYRPSYRRMFDRVRSGGAQVWMHLCGNVEAIIPDLIDIGLNVLNPVQPRAMDVRVLSREFGGTLCFYGGVDVQGTLINGSPDDVRREVHELVHLFGRFGGGYIGSTSHTIMPETPLDNVIALYEAFAQYQDPAVPARWCDADVGG
jgi:uroporphyrinogen decarboxylase